MVKGTFQANNRKAKDVRGITFAAPALWLANDAPPYITALTDS